MTPERAFSAFGCLMAGLGVTLLAAAAHGGYPALDQAALVALTHGIGLLALSAAIAARLLARRIALAGAAALVIGIVLFCGEIAYHAFSGDASFESAAPIGGTTIIIAWIALAVAALLASDDARRMS